MQTLNQVLKAIRAYADANGQAGGLIEVKHIVESTNYNSPKTEYKFEAYINGFGIFAKGANSSELINQFDKAAQNIPVSPIEQGTQEWEDLPF